MEILNNAQVTPQRLHALVRLVDKLRRPTRKELFDLLQPEAISPNQKAATAVFQAALRYGLIVQDEEIVDLHPSLDKFQPIDDPHIFRQCCQDKLTAIIEDSADNYLLNLFTAWYAVQNEFVFEETTKALTDHFNRDLYPAENVTEDEEYAGRAFNTTKFNGWRNWATFLGWGWSGSIGHAAVIPDATLRLHDIFPRVLPEQEFVPLRTFMGRLSEQCPELDGGKLFVMCWEASRSSEQKGNRVSLMLSTGLRVLHDLGMIELQRLADATDRWQLFTADGALFNEITHIRARA